MLNITTSPAIPFDCLQLMRLVHDIEFKLAGQQGAVWCYVKKAITDKYPAKKIVVMVQDMAIDNYNAVADVLGVVLTDRILSHDYKPKA